jgi:predicted RNA-binding Zn-ribbon protein involved in translation (DUF1610 family)
MSYDDNDEQTHLLHPCQLCGEELTKGSGPHECPSCGTEYTSGGTRIWPDDPLRDLQDM